jgi:hypothetical protein
MTKEYEIDRENRDWGQVDRENRDWEMTMEYEIGQVAWSGSEGGGGKRGKAGGREG